MCFGGISFFDSLFRFFLDVVCGLDHDDIHNTYNNLVTMLPLDNNNVAVIRSQIAIMTVATTDDNEEEYFLKERRQAELDMILAAYSQDEEVWITTNPTAVTRIHRKLVASDGTTVGFLLELVLPDQYPDVALEVASVRVDHSSSSSSSSSSTTNCFIKAAHDSIQQLTKACRNAADRAAGGEAVFLVFNAAEEWLQDQWPIVCQAYTATSIVSSTEQDTSATHSSNPVSNNNNTNNMTLGRRLIYSHHIISTTKRAHIMELASNLQLTGYMKIGWPGILLIEGLEDDCQEFYDTIRQWQWQYLVVRGEMQETMVDDNDNDNDTATRQRCFDRFLQVNDMAVVANHCRQVGLEALFRTSMKVYDNSTEKEESVENDLYGVLVHVDHMNDGKNYRKWLRKTCEQYNTALLIKHCVTDIQYKDGKPTILVGLIGDRSSVHNVLKRWRTSRVDVDSRNRQCLERMMTILIEGTLEPRRSRDRLDWDQMSVESGLLVSLDEAMGILESIGGSSWSGRLTDLLKERFC